MVFLFLRTPFPVLRAEESVDQISEEFETICPWEFHFEGSDTAWSSGVLLVFTVSDPQAFAAILTKRLTRFEAWAIYWETDHDRPAGAVESALSGRFMEKFLQEHRDLPMCQAYLKFDPDNRRHKDTVAQIRSEFCRHGDCQTVFHFSDGEVWFYCPDDIQNPVFSRVQVLSRNLPGFVYFDNKGVLRTPSGAKEPNCLDPWFAEDEDEVEYDEVY